MFKRRKDEERTELDAAWDDENASATSAQPAGDEGEPGASGEAGESQPSFTGVVFPEPNEFNITADVVPTDSVEREAATGVPFDAEDSFAYDAESEEFTSGGAAGFLDDSHTDYYKYGEPMHGVHGAVEDPDAAGAEESVAVVGSSRGRHGSGRATKQARTKGMTEHQRRSRNVRRILIVVILLVVALMAALGYFGWRLFQESRSVAVQEGAGAVAEVEQAAGNEEVSQDAATANVKKTDVPTLMGVLGLSRDEAIEKIGHGATVTLDSTVDDPSSAMSHRLTVVLADEPADAKSGAPTVYLGMDADEKVVTAGYSAAMASLGFGAFSFADAVTHEHVVEKTLGEAGLTAPEGSVKLPEASSYSTYASDGTTLVKEQCAFDGQVQQGGKDYLWTSVLVYNYTAANATGNLSDTVRQIYVYVSEKEAFDAAVAAKAKSASEDESSESSEAETSEAAEAAEE